MFWFWSWWVILSVSGLWRCGEVELGSFVSVFLVFFVVVALVELKDTQALL